MKCTLISNQWITLKELKMQIDLFFSTGPIDSLWCLGETVTESVKSPLRSSLADVSPWRRIWLRSLQPPVLGNTCVRTGQSWKEVEGWEDRGRNKAHMFGKRKRESVGGGAECCREREQVYVCLPLPSVSLWWCVTAGSNSVCSPLIRCLSLWGCGCYAIKLGLLERIVTMQRAFNSGSILKTPECVMSEINKKWVKPETSKPMKTDKGEIHTRWFNQEVKWC